MTAMTWFYTGVALILLELLTPGFVLMFFGIAALLVALMSWALPAGFMAATEWWFFGAFSIGSILLLRKWIKNVFTGESDTEGENGDASFTGNKVVVTVDIRPPMPGKVELNGVSWNAEVESADSAGADAGAAAIEKGALVEIVRRHNLTLIVKRLA